MLGELLGQSKVDDLEYALHQQEVLRLDVQVHDPLSVHVSQGL